MKKILLLILLALCLTVIPAVQSEAKGQKVTISEAVMTSDSASVSGTTDALAVMLRITDASDNIIVMQSFAVSADGSFEIKIDDVTYADGEYKVSVADYEGGTWTTETVKVETATEEPSGSPSPSPSEDISSSPSPSPSEDISTSPSPSPAGTVTPGASPSPSPAVVSPAPTPEPTPTTPPTETPTPEPTTTPAAELKVGDKIKSTKYNAEYKILETGDKDGKVGKLAYLRPIKQKIAHTVNSKVTIDGITYKVTTIASNAFNGNTKIESITIGKYVTKIGKKAFYGCTSLKSANIGSSVTTIGTKAFAKTSALQNVIIESKYLKAENIGKSVFAKAGTSKNKPTFTVPAKMLNSYKKLFGKYGNVTK